MTTEYAITLASTAGTSASVSKSSRNRTSTARSAAPSGVLKTAEMPAATPATSRMRRSRGETDRARATAEPTAPPICTVGLSRPRAPSVPSVRIDARALTQMTRRRARPPPWWYARIIASPPPPRVSGTACVSRPEPSAPRAGRMSSTHGRKVDVAACASSGSPWARSGVYPASFWRHTRSTSSSPPRNTSATAPAARPTSAECRSTLPRSSKPPGIASAMTPRRRLRPRSKPASGRGASARRIPCSRPPGLAGAPGASGASGASTLCVHSILHRGGGASNIRAT